ncbi:MAG: AMP-binding protein [Planctomycetota bacterium]|nr:AMP-binding protein [Planctomycetota bacterium]
MPNLAARLRDHAARFPEKPAVILCRGPGKSGQLRIASHSFAELERDSDAAARGLLAAGVGRGCVTLVMLRPSFAFFSCFFALLKIGAVPALIDPGMGVARLLECVRRLAPAALVGVPAAHLVRLLRPGCFPGLRTAVTVGRRWLWGGQSWERLRRFDSAPFPLAGMGDGDLAAILFTTGSTGPAKGVEYTHAALGRQIDILSWTFGITPEDRDAAAFPGFSLFSIALGMTAVVPDLDPTRPGQVHPPNIIAPIRELGCTFSFGSPTLWDRVSAYAERGGVRLPSLRRVVMAGAPIPAVVHRRLLGGTLPPEGGTFTPYGATEVMPAACLDGREALAETAGLTLAGRGVCVGRPVPEVRVEIIRIDDGPIPEWDAALLAPPGEIGEIVVLADHASRHYHRLPAADALAKIADGGRFWHRMGDVGWLDGKGRLWFCGRKSHRVRTPAGDLFTVCCEAIFNQSPEAARSALIGLPGADGFAKPALVVEPIRKIPRPARRAAADALFRLGQANQLTRDIRLLFFHPRLPTDIRHNAKIRREDLAIWAAGRLREGFRLTSGL